jgi:hypothetical protein
MENTANDFTGGSRCVFTGDTAAFNLRMWSKHKYRQ